MSTRPGFRAALARPRFRRLCLAHGLATVAQLVLTLAVSLHVLEATGSGVWVSASVALAFAPYALCSPLAGVLADRRSRSAVLLGSCEVRAVLTAVVAAGLALAWPPALVVAVTALAAVAATPSYPALAAATPECVEDAELPAANALVTCVENATWIGGPGVFGLVLLTGAGPGGAVAVAGVLLLLAATAVLPVRLPRPAGAPGAGAPTAGTRTVWARDLRAGYGLVAGRREVRSPMTLAVLDNFLYGYLVVALVLMVDHAGLGSDRLGWLNGALAAGAVASMAVVNRVCRGSAVSGRLVAVLAGFCACVAVVGLLGPTPLVLGVVVLAGAATLVAEVAAVTLLQRAAPPAVLARVFGVYDQLNVGAIALGSLVAGPLASAWGPGPALAGVAGACLLLVGLAVSADRPRPVPAGRAPLGLPPWPATSSSSLPSTSRAAAPSSSCRASPGRRRPSAIPSTRR